MDENPVLRGFAAGSETVHFSCTACRRDFAAARRDAEARYAKGGRCVLCGGRLRFPFLGDSNIDELPAGEELARCTVCGFVLPAGRHPLCTRCDTPHMVESSRARRAPVDPAPDAERRAVVDALPAPRSPAAALLRALLLNDAPWERVALDAARAFSTAEASSWPRATLPVPLPLARDLCAHVLLRDAALVDDTTVRFTLQPGVTPTVGEALVEGVRRVGDALLPTRFEPELPERQHGRCRLRPTRDGVLLVVTPALTLSLSGHLLDALAHWLILGRLHAYFGWPAALRKRRVDVLAWLLRVVVLGAAGRAPTVALPAALDDGLRVRGVDDPGAADLLALGGPPFPG